MKKINLLYISIALVVVITLVLLIYQYTSCKPKKIEIDENNIEIEELPETDHIMQEINNKILKAICAIETDKFQEKDYYNYVIGRGKGKEVNCSLLLKMDGQYYELKTILEGDTQAPKVNISGCIKSKYLKDNFELLLYDKEKQKIYKYTRGNK